MLTTTGTDLDLYQHFRLRGPRPGRRDQFLGYNACHVQPLMHSQRHASSIQEGGCLGGAEAYCRRGRDKYLLHGYASIHRASSPYEPSTNAPERMESPQTGTTGASRPLSLHLHLSSLQRRPNSVSSLRPGSDTVIQLLQSLSHQGEPPAPAYSQIDHRRRNYQATSDHLVATPTEPPPGHRSTQSQD